MSITKRSVSQVGANHHAREKNNALNSVPGVYSATVTIPDSAVVRGTAKTADLKAALRKAGYRATLR